MTTSQNRQTLLLVDDDVELCALLSDYLLHEGYEVAAVHDGRTAIDSLRQRSYGALILDVMLPEIQGFDVLRKVRAFSDIPVLMLTARGEDTDRIVGLELGADDYLPKPCNPRELVARIRAILRRTTREDTEESALEVHGLQLNPSDRSAAFLGKPLELTTAEFNILRVLIAEAGRVVSKEILTEKALGRPLTAYDRSVDVHVSNIRKKLIAAGAEQDNIKSIRGVGYQYLIAAESRE